MVPSGRLSGTVPPGGCIEVVSGETIHEIGIQPVEIVVVRFGLTGRSDGPGQGRSQCPVDRFEGGSGEHPEKPLGLEPPLFHDTHQLGRQGAVFPLQHGPGGPSFGFVDGVAA